jgi:hypothetical protein
MPAGQDASSWWGLVSVALGSGLISGLVTQVIGWKFKERDDEKRIRRASSFLAISIASSLEEFSINCASVIQNISNHNSSGGEIGEIAALPLLPEYPSNLDWTGFERVLCSRVLSLRHELELSRRAVDFSFEIEGHLAEGDETSQQASTIGLRAWQLAADLRRYYDLPHFRIDEYGWDFTRVLEAQALKSREKATAGEVDIE